MKRWILTSALILSLAACGGSTDGNGQKIVDNPLPTTSPHPSVVSVTVTTTATVKPSPPPAPATPHLGQTVQLTTGGATLKVSVLEVQTDITPGNPYEKPDAGSAYYAILAQLCIVKARGNHNTESVSTLPWSLHFDSGAVADSSTYISETPSVNPPYPDNAPIPVGSCAKGWIVYQGPKDAKPALAVYSPSVFGDAQSVVFRLAK